METGTITNLRIEKGYGFIRADGRDVFFHFSTLADDLEFTEALQERRVQFKTETGPKGERATVVKAI